MLLWQLLMIQHNKVELIRTSIFNDYNVKIIAMLNNFKLILIQK